MDFTLAFQYPKRVGVIEELAGETMMIVDLPPFQYPNRVGVIEERFDTQRVGDLVFVFQYPKRVGVRFGVIEEPCDYEQRLDVRLGFRTLIGSGL